jgi:hypothetical protein
LVQQFGPQPIGYFVHDPTGHASVQIMRTPFRAPAGGTDGATVDELRDLLKGYYAAFGTYSVDVERTEAVYNIEGSTRPEIIATTVLPYRIAGESLIIGDGKTWRRVWQRVSRVSLPSAEKRGGATVACWLAHEVTPTCPGTPGH